MNPWHRQTHKRHVYSHVHCRAHRAYYTPYWRLKSTLWRCTELPLWCRDAYYVRVHAPVSAFSSVANNTSRRPLQSIEAGTHEPTMSADNVRSRRVVLALVAWHERHRQTWRPSPVNTSQHNATTVGRQKNDSRHNPTLAARNVGRECRCVGRLSACVPPNLRVFYCNLQSTVPPTAVATNAAHIWNSLTHHIASTPSYITETA